MGIEQTFSSWEAIYFRLRANFDGLVSEYIPHPPPGSGARPVNREGEREGRASYSLGKTVVGLQKNGDEKGDVVVESKDTQTGEGESREADLVVAADGPSSTVRQLFEPDAKRRYAGYCGWRGTLSEEEVSKETWKFLGDVVTFCKIERSYIIS